jgi:hypothetical protein
MPEVQNTTTIGPDSKTGPPLAGVAQTGRTAVWTGGAASGGLSSIEIFRYGEMSIGGGHRDPDLPVEEKRGSELISM